MKFKFFLFGFLIILLLISLLFVVLSRNSTDIKKDIQSQELVYTCNCGWINWGHAKPKGVYNLIDQVVNDTSLTAGTKEIVYGQNMKINLVLGSKMVAEVSRRYSITPGLSQKEREEIAFEIFKATSISFERMQGTFPFNLSSGSQNSSFKDGDLTGDKIAFYRALRGYTKDDIVEICNPVFISESLKLLQEGKYGKNDQWIPALWKSHGAYPQKLNDLNTDTTILNKNLLFLGETKNIYLE